jgi:pimeloyl-ACP methyl ester carboxylesterase
MGRRFAVALLYLISQWLATLVRRKPVQVITQSDGEQDGFLTHRYIKVKKTLSGRATDVSFHFVESPARERECIVFLHGYMDSWRLWRSQLACFTHGYHMVAFDLKGSGQSSMNYLQRLFPEVNDAGGDYSLEMQADELVTALDQLGIQHFNLVTLDLGTIIGDILAGKYPERVRRYMRCQQPLVGHFRASIPQGRILRSQRGARLLTAILEGARGALLRILYGRTGWPVLDSMKRTKQPMPDEALRDAMQETSHVFRNGPRTGKPGVFACAWAGLYQHNRDYMRYLRDNLHACSLYSSQYFSCRGHTTLPCRARGSTGRQVWLSRRYGLSCCRGLGDGYVPWGDLIPGCTRPLHAKEFFPNAPYVALEFVDAGHFVPLEASETFNRLLEQFLTSR